MIRAVTETCTKSYMSSSSKPGAPENFLKKEMTSELIH